MEITTIGLDVARVAEIAVGLVRSGSAVQPPLRLITHKNGNLYGTAVSSSIAFCPKGRRQLGGPGVLAPTDRGE